ncbi:MAG: radical SAM protein [Singulisphaera sp.]
MSTESSRLGAIREKVEAGQRLSFDDGLALEGSDDLFAIGAMANQVRERKNGNFGYYNVNTHINPTNVCVYKCDFCAFRADLDEARAYVMTREQITERARQAHERGATELHIVGGLHHKLPFDYYVDVVRWIHDDFAELHIKAYTAVEVEFFAKISRLSTQGFSNADRRRAGKPSRRWCRDLSSRGPRADLRRQGVDGELARNPSDRASARPALERHHALRPHRRPEAPDRPHGPAPRAAR